MHCAKSRAGYLFRVVVVGGGDVAVILFHFSFRLRQMNSDGITQQQYGIEEFVVFVWWVWNICMIIHNVPKEREKARQLNGSIFGKWWRVSGSQIPNHLLMCNKLGKLFGSQSERRPAFIWAVFGMPPRKCITSRRCEDLVWWSFLFDYRCKMACELVDLQKCLLTVARS